MNRSRQLHTICGAVLLTMAVTLNVLALTPFFVEYPDTWTSTSLALYLALAGFLFFVGTRELRRGRGKAVMRPQIRWGYLLAGSWITFAALKIQFAPSSGGIGPSNAVDAAETMMITCGLVALGVALMLLAFRFKKDSNVENKNIAPVEN